MIPSNLRFGGGVSETVLNPLVAVIVLIAGILICALPRRKAVAPFLAACILIPTDQVLLLGSLHFPMMRIIILFGFIRLAAARLSSRTRIFSGGLNRLDILLILLAVTRALAGVLLWQESAAFVYQLGELYNVFGIYLFLRFAIPDLGDIERTIRVLAYIAATVAGVMVFEQAAGWNPYALLGGAHSSFYGSLMERGDRFRASGCFAHPILAGTFGAVLLPMFIGLCWRGKTNRIAAAIGFLGATVMVIASNSSTPILAYLAAIVGLCFWPVRRRMQVFRWGLVLLLISLHLLMKAPVWHLISRIDVVGGSSSYHRYQLVDQFIRHFGDWWLVGTKSNADWGWVMWDTANQYVELGQTSGLVPLLFFFAVIAHAFRYLGIAGLKARSHRKIALFFWSLSAAVLANVVAFFGISYFDQTVVAWYTLLAMVCACVHVPQAQLVTVKNSARNVPVLELTPGSSDVHPEFA